MTGTECTSKQSNYGRGRDRHGTKKWKEEAGGEEQG